MRTLEYLFVTALGVALVYLLVVPLVDATAQSIINSTEQLERVTYG